MKFINYTCNRCGGRRVGVGEYTALCSVCLADRFEDEEDPAELDVVLATWPNASGVPSFGVPHRIAQVERSKGLAVGDVISARTLPGDRLWQSTCTECQGAGSIMGETCSFCGGACVVALRGGGRVQFAEDGKRSVVYQGCGHRFELNPRGALNIAFSCPTCDERPTSNDGGSS